MTRTAARAEAPMAKTEAKSLTAPLEPAAEVVESEDCSKPPMAEVVAAAVVSAAEDSEDSEDSEASEVLAALVEEVSLRPQWKPTWWKKCAWWW